MTLTPQQIEDWKTALRSGDYEQSHGTWQHRGALCCLNVLCKINEQPLIGGSDGHNEGRQWLETAIPGLAKEAFMKMNDHDRLKFVEIADRVDEVLA